MNEIEFIEQVKLNKAVLYNFAIKLTRDQDDANDLVQETNYRAFKNLDRFLAGSDFKAWVTTIMRNIFFNSYRKNKRKWLFENNLRATQQRQPMYQTVRNQGESNQTINELERMVDSLNEELRDSFILRYNGYRYNEIAERLNVPLGTVKSRIFFAKRRLKFIIQSSYGVTHFFELD